MYAKYCFLALYSCVSIVCHAQKCTSDTLETANDFAFSMITGEDTTLYALSADAVLLCFYDPTCEDCHELMKQLDSLPIIRRLIADKRLIALAVYPEEDTVVWRANTAHVPAGWLNGYDPGVKIILDDLYDFVKLPTLYLLDSKKRFILKNASAEDVEKALKKME